MEHDGKDGVVELIVDLNTVDTHIQRRRRVRPRIIDPETFERLSLDVFPLPFRSEQCRSVTVEDDFLHGPVDTPCAVPREGSYRVIARSVSLSQQLPVIRIRFTFCLIGEVRLFKLVVGIVRQRFDTCLLLLGPNHFRFVQTDVEHLFACDVVDNRETDVVNTNLNALTRRLSQRARLDRRGFQRARQARERTPDTVLI